MTSAPSRRRLRHDGLLQCAFRFHAGNGRVTVPAVGGRPSSRWLGDSEVCMYTACMPNVQIREVPEDVHEALVRKAELAGQSLQQYLSAQLVVIASTPTVDEVIDLIERRQKGSVSRTSTIAALQDERARR